MILTEHLARLKEITEKATSGPWATHESGTVICDVGGFMKNTVVAPEDHSNPTLETDVNVANFIAQFNPLVTRALLECVDALAKIIKADQYEAIYPQGPSIARLALSNLTKVLDEQERRE